jgi:hypothetical protein
MRLVWFACALTAAALFAAPAAANEVHLPRANALTYVAVDAPGSNVTVVNRGQTLAIMCPNAGAPGSDVRVVMALDAVRGEAPTGYQAVLATDQTVQGNGVRVRVPDVPDLANHTVTVKVYVTDAKGATASCNAGHVRIV